MTFAQAMIAVALGGLIGFASSFTVSRIERGHAAKAELRRVVARYQAEAGIAVARLSELPPAGEPGMASKLLERIQGEHAVWAQTQAGLTRTLGAEWRAPIERLMSTAAELRLMNISEDLRSAMGAVEDYIDQLAADRTPELKARWADLREGLERASAAAARG